MLIGVMTKDFISNFANCKSICCILVWTLKEKLYCRISKVLGI